MPQNHPKIKNILQLNILIDHAGGSDGKESACNAGEPGLIPASGRSPGEGTATHTNIFAWRISWTKEPGRLQSMGLERV